MKTRHLALALGLLSIAGTASAAITIEVYPSVAPNAFGSPSYDPWVGNAIYALENNLSTYGASGPAQYNRVTNITWRDISVYGFNVWRGVYNPGSPYGSELGNRLHFGLHAKGNGTKFSLSQVSFAMHSSDPNDDLVFVSSFGSGDVYSNQRVGIDYGPDLVKGGGDDVIITSGPATQLVDELMYRGPGNAWAGYSPTNQSGVDLVRDYINDLGPFKVTTTFTIGAATGSATVNVLPTDAVPSRFPVDLDGSYRAASSSPLQRSPDVRSSSGFAIAATVPIDFSGGSVFERSGVTTVPENVVNGTFTPFNDGVKKPNNLTVSPEGSNFMADVEISGTWKPFVFGGEVSGIPFAQGDVFGLGWTNATNSFGVQVVNEYYSGQFAVRLSKTMVGSGALGVGSGSQYLVPAGTTKLRVYAEVVGGLLKGLVMPLDGPDAETIHSIGSTDGTDLTGGNHSVIGLTTGGFLAGFETMEHPDSSANATVRNYTSNCQSNVLYAFADDPYIRTLDGAGSINYRVGQSNLGVPVTGWQAFMNAGGSQTFVSGSYAGPYSTFFPGSITSALDASGADAYSNGQNTDVATLSFTPGGGESATGAGFRANTGTQINLFADDNFNTFNATCWGSNTVLIDNTAPTLGVPVLGGTGYVAPNAVVGDLDITVNAADNGAFASGLDGRPSGQIAWASGPPTTISTFSYVGNTFHAVVPITYSTPNGPATLTLSVCDRAGNCSTQTLNFNVSTVNVYLTLNELGVGGTVNRWVKITLGGNGGTRNPITVNKLVTFTGGTGTTAISYQDLYAVDNTVPVNAAFSVVGAKDPFFSLFRKTALAGTPSNFTATVNMTMGDLTDNNVVNVADLAVWAANNGSSQSVDTAINQSASPRQANVDGVGTVGLGDRNLVTASWLQAGDSPVGMYGGGGGGAAGGGGARMRVMDVILETGLNKATVKSMDLNNDGWITREEVLAWSGGKK